jgi:hypothetical protein
MDAFKRACQWKRSVDFAATSFSRRETKYRPQSFSPRKQTVAHRSVNRGRLRARLWQIAVQSAVDQLLASDKIGFEIHVTKTAAG